MSLEPDGLASRDDFFRTLAEAQASTRRLLSCCPDELILRSVAGQLEAMRRWSADGRTPRPEERRSLDFGTSASGELDAGALRDLAHQLFALQRYFAAWPGDAPVPEPPRFARRLRGAYQRVFRCA